MNTETSRNQEQVMAMSAIYSFLTYLDMNQEVDVEAIVESATGLDYKESPLFVKEAILGTIKNYQAIVAVFQPRMEKWTFSRLNRVEQAILLLAYCHYFFLDLKVEKSIVIDVSVRQAKGYLDDGDYKFVNAILDKVLVRG